MSLFVALCWLYFLYASMFVSIGVSVSASVSGKLVLSGKSLRFTRLMVEFGKAT